jgi:flagellar biosynthesis/type III secretory pathway M-ring protein FliF/YscJ
MALSQSALQVLGAAEATSISGSVAEEQKFWEVRLYQYIAAGVVGGLILLIATVCICRRRRARQAVANKRAAYSESLFQEELRDDSPATPLRLQ